VTKKASTIRNIKVHGADRRAVFTPAHGGYEYAVSGPVSTIEGWVQGDIKDAVAEAVKHAEEKIPK